MFEMLRVVDRRTAAEAAYRISLRIYEREHSPEWRRWLPLRPGDVRVPEALDVAARVLDEIEQRTGTPLGRLTDDRIEPYRRRIHEIMRERRAAEHPDPEGVGKRLLEEMRRDYAVPARRAVA